MIKLLTLRASQFKQLQDIDLRFPQSGSVLIEGRNEAGKSTLFEAIYFALFGRTLVAGTSVDDLIGYQATEAVVYLELAVGEQRFVIQRKVRRTKTRNTTDSRMRIFDADGTEKEEVRGSSAVNERIEQELKLDADAFLNSCFVEQKKLEKLEGLSARDRETSLMRLLNMDRILDEERSLRVTLDDTRRLERLQQRVRLAEVMAEIPGVRKRGVETKQALDMIALKETLAVSAAARAAIADAEARIAALEAPIRELEERVRRTETVRAAVSASEVIAVHLGALEAQIREVERLREQLAALDHAAAEELPAMETRLRQAKWLRSRWSRLIGLSGEADRAEADAKELKRRLDDVEAARQAVADLEARVRAEAEKVATLEAEERALATQERAVNVRQALEDWLAAANARDGVGAITQQEAQAKSAAASAQGELDRARERTAQAQRAKRTSDMVGVLTALVALAALVAGVLIRPLWPVSVLVIIVGSSLVISRGRKTGQAVSQSAAEEARLSDALRDAENALVRLEGQMENARATSGAAAGRLDQAVLRLEAAEEPVPASVRACEERLAALPSTAVDAERLAVVRRDVAQAQGVIDELRRAVAARQAEAEGANPRVLQAGLERLEQRAARIREAIVAPWAESARERSRALGLETARDLLAERELATCEELAIVEQIKALNRRRAERPAVEQRVARAEAEAGRHREEVAAVWPKVAAVRPEADPPVTLEEATTLKTGLQADLEALDEAETAAQLRARRTERGAVENERAVAQQQAEASEAESHRRADALKYPPDEPLTEPALADALAGWEAADPARKDALEAEFEELKDRNATLNARRQDLSAALGLDPATEKLDPEKERKERDAVQRDFSVREKAITILKAARDRIMSKVLPYTIEHMRRILPALTMDRYHDAKLTPDYKIEVWDERASMWKSKNIFSGGTRDQFSLALRLAFAVATLPQERGAAPGFIFLDEPLSSFDVERSSALMYLLTKGEIAETFDQILVISHSQAIAADDFQYRLRMDSGRIEEVPEEMRPAPAQAELIADGS